MTGNLDQRETATTSVKRKEPKALNQSAAKRLLAYASVAAGAACIPQAHAEVIYTPVHSSINHDYGLDLNNDGIVDFRITSSGFSEIYSMSVKAVVRGNRIAATHNKGCSLRLKHGSAAALPAGAVIGPKMSLNRGATCMYSGYFGANGPWVGLENHYLGLAFVIDGKTHFGWARLSVNGYYCPCIGGYAYETEPGKAIIAGDEGSSANAEIVPGSLGALALGAASPTGKVN